MHRAIPNALLLVGIPRIYYHRGFIQKLERTMFSAENSLQNAELNDSEMAANEDDDAGKLPISFAAAAFNSMLGDEADFSGVDLKAWDGLMHDGIYHWDSEGEDGVVENERNGQGESQKAESGQNEILSTAANECNAPEEKLNEDTSVAAVETPKDQIPDNLEFGSDVDLEERVEDADLNENYDSADEDSEEYACVVQLRSDEEFSDYACLETEPEDEELEEARIDELVDPVSDEENIEIDAPIADAHEEATDTREANEEDLASECGVRESSVAASNSNHDEDGYDSDISEEDEEEEEDAPERIAKPRTPQPLISQCKREPGVATMRPKNLKAAPSSAQLNILFGRLPTEDRVDEFEDDWNDDPSAFVKEQIENLAPNGRMERWSIGDNAECCHHAGDQVPDYDSDWNDDCATPRAEQAEAANDGILLEMPEAVAWSMNSADLSDVFGAFEQSGSSDSVNASADLIALHVDDYDLLPELAPALCQETCLGIDSVDLIDVYGPLEGNNCDADAAVTESEQYEPSSAKILPEVLESTGWDMTSADLSDVFGQFEGKSVREEDPCDLIDLTGDLIDLSASDFELIPDLKEDLQEMDAWDMAADDFSDVYGHLELNISSNKRDSNFIDFSEFAASNEQKGAIPACGYRSFMADMEFLVSSSGDATGASDCETNSTILIDEIDSSDLSEDEQIRRMEQQIAEEEAKSRDLAKQMYNLARVTEALQRCTDQTLAETSTPTDRRIPNGALHDSGYCSQSNSKNEWKSSPRSTGTTNLAAPSLFETPRSARQGVRRPVGFFNLL